MPEMAHPDRCAAEIGGIGNWHGCPRQAHFWIEFRQDNRWMRMGYCLDHAWHALDPRYVHQPVVLPALPERNGRPVLCAWCLRRLPQGWCFVAGHPNCGRNHGLMGRAQVPAELQA